MPIPMPRFVTQVFGARRPGRHDDLWSVAQRLDDLNVGDITGYDPDRRVLSFTDLDPMRLERSGRRPLTAEQIEDLQDKLASLRY